RHRTHGVRAAPCRGTFDRGDRADHVDEHQCLEAGDFSRRAQAARRAATAAVIAMKPNPIRDNDLILYFYHDGLDAARLAEIDAALRVSEPLRARYAALRRTLEAADAAPTIEPDADFVRRVWRRLEQRIDAAAPKRRSWADSLRDLLDSLLSPRFAL